MRTSGTGNESLMTMVILGVALGVGITLFGGPVEAARAVNDIVRNLVGSGVALVQGR